MTGTPQHSVSVAAAVTDERGWVLAVRRADNGHWEPPGGVLERDEGIEEGLCREVLEETGLRLGPTTLTGVYKNMARGILALVFRCESFDGDPAASEEAVEVRWLTPDEVPQLMTEAYAIRVLDALHSSTPAVREHDGTRLLPPHR